MGCKEITSTQKQKEKVTFLNFIMSLLRQLCVYLEKIKPSRGIRCVAFTITVKITSVISTFMSAVQHTSTNHFIDTCSFIHSLNG